MPFVAAPGIVRASIAGLIGAQPWATIMYWRDGVLTAPFTATQLNNWITAFTSAYNAQFNASVANNVSINTITVTDIGSNTGIQVVGPSSPIVGGFSGKLEPASLAGNFQYQIAARYRGGHPRGFWPVLLSSQLVDESHWLPLTVSTYTTKFQTMITTMQTSLVAGAWGTPTHTVPRWTYTITDDPAHHKYKRVRSGYIRSDNVVGYALNATVGSQRNRLRL